MMCDCPHAVVCRYRLNIVDSIHPVIEPVFGIYNQDGPEAKIMKLVQESCRFRQQSLKKEQS